MDKNSECCPKFNVVKWDKKTFVWENKKFIKDSIPEFFHIPLSSMISKKISRMCKAIEKNEAASPDKKDTLILFRDPTPFKGEIYISVEKNIPSENNVEISGDFVSRVFDGGYSNIPRFVKEMDRYLEEIGKKAKDYYIHYAYCPKCAKKFENNYMILFAKI